MLAAIGYWGKISLVILGLVAGCGGPSADCSGIFHTASWSTDKKPAVQGVDFGTTVVVTLKCPATEIHRFVIWSDVFKTLLRSQGNNDGSRYDHTLITPDGRQIGITAVIKSGQPGYMQIGNARFQLTDGMIFLVSTVNNKVTVKQLQSGAEAFTNYPELKLPQIQELQKSQPAIREFFEAQQPATGT